MALVLNDEQRMLRDAAREFLRRPARRSRPLRALRDARRHGRLRRATVAEMAEMGWAGIAHAGAVRRASASATPELGVVLRGGAAARWPPRRCCPRRWSGGTGHAAGGSGDAEAGAAAARSRAATCIVRARAGGSVAPRSAGGRDHAPRPRTTASSSTAASCSCSTAMSPTSSSSSRAPAGGPARATGIALFLVDRDAPGLAVDRGTRWSTAATRRACGSSPCASTRTRARGLRTRLAGAGAGARHRPRRASRPRCSGSRREALRAHARLPEAAQAVRRADRQLPGAAAPRRATVLRDRAVALGGAEGAAGARRGRRRALAAGQPRQGASGRTRRSWQRTRRCRCTAASA